MILAAVVGTACSKSFCQFHDWFKVLHLPGESWLGLEVIGIIVLKTQNPDVADICLDYPKLNEMNL